MIPALILAGGLGTRLRHVVGEIPKPLAPVAGRPFLGWLLESLAAQGVREAVLSIGYRAELIQQALGPRFAGIDLHYVVETEPLGTGGAIALARQSFADRDLLVLNGDTFAACPLATFIAEAQDQVPRLSIALHQVADTARFGAVETAGDGTVTAFLEKGRQGPGVINAGIYHLPAAFRFEAGQPARFSFEQDVLVPFAAQGRVHGLTLVEDFIDIGVPEDYARAQTKVPALARREA